KHLLFSAFPEGYNRYAERFSHVMNGLKYGNSFLVNLTIKTPVETNLSLKEIFLRSKAMYRLYVPERFVCFSPERFVKITDGKIFSHPMKGTINASIENAAQLILNDYKETAEHNTIVDLLRNDLSRVATRVKVNRFRYIDTLDTNTGSILQVSSEIEGTLPENYLENIGTIFFDLLPAGSVSGAPKQATLQLIREAEQKTRGFYTGVAGYFDGQNLDSGVLIRYIEQTENGFYFRSGGGITINSECAKEYAEAVNKIYLPIY
ncbi:MAG: aminodeoxychorismate synthase component I, partial [Bacteroidia bacterium]|nr:aminodeoxychorismate synthase component I [Bacteroidia bacterium]